MEENPNQELQQKQETAVSTQRSRRGFEQPIDNSDLIIPRVMLIQNTPPKTVEIDRKQCPPGTIINSVTAQPISDENGSMIVIPIIFGMKWIRWNAQDKNKPGYDPNFELGAKIWESKDPKDPRVLSEGQFGPAGEAPLATKLIEFLVMIPGQKMPIVLSFMKTSYNAGKRLLTLAQFAEEESPDLFGMKYKVSAKETQNAEKQSYFILKVDPAGKCSEDEFKKAESLYNKFHGADIKVHGEEEEAAEPAAKKQPWE